MLAELVNAGAEVSFKSALIATVSDMHAKKRRYDADFEAAEAK